MYTSIELGKNEDVSQSFDQHLTDLYLDKKISFEIARDAASSPSNFERNLEFGSVAKKKTKVNVNKTATPIQEPDPVDEDQNSGKSSLVLEDRKKD